jgi:hypothetical protein
MTILNSEGLSKTIESRRYQLATLLAAHTMPIHVMGVMVGVCFVSEAAKANFIKRANPFVSESVLGTNIKIFFNEKDFINAADTDTFLDRISGLKDNCIII